MRKRVWIPLVVILAVCLLLLMTTKHQHVVLPVDNAALTNLPGEPEQPRIVEHHQITGIPRTAIIPAPATPFAEALAKTNPLAAWRLELWQAPIAFYGKVVDENSNAVAGAQVGFHWVEMPTEEGNRTSKTESDSEGLFFLHGARGPTLSVLVTKEGYYTSRSTPNGFHYALANEILHPDPQNPVIFMLKKKGQGAKLITSEKGMQLDVAVRVPKDNTPVRVDFYQKQASATGQLEISQNKPPFQRATNWSFRLSIPDGGLVENQDEFQFEAPDTGYQPTLGYDFTKGETNWTTQVTKQFYIVFGQPCRYGWLRFESNLAQETVFVTYAINPSGSRNLEPAQ